MSFVHVRDFLWQQNTFLPEKRPAVTGSTLDVGRAATHINVCRVAKHINVGRAAKHINIGRAATHINVGRAAKHTNVGRATKHIKNGSNFQWQFIGKQTILLCLTTSYVCKTGYFFVVSSHNERL